MLLGISLMLFQSVYAANLTPGSQYVFTGTSVRGTALGWTGMSELGNIQDMSYNPAALGDLRRVANNLSIGGFGSTNSLINLGFAYPSLSGVFSLGIDYISGPASSLYLNQWISLRAGISKAITENLFWGFDLDFASVGGNMTNDWTLGFDMGIIRAKQDDSNGAGFKNFSYGIALKNIGKNAQLGSYDLFPGMGLSLGASFYPLLYKPYKLKVSSDIHFSWSPLDFQAGIGIEQTLLDLISLRAGYTYSANGIGPFSLGAGFGGVILVQETKTDVKVDYSASQQSFNGASEWMHKVNLNVAWGYYDDKAPQVDVEAKNSAFSPNYDGSQDTIELKLQVKDNTLVDSWEVEVQDNTGKVIKTFKSVEKLQIRNLTLGKVTKQIFSAKKQVEIPESISWDGQDETGARVPDGDYTYVLRAWDENANKSESKAGTVKIDTLVPQLVVSQTNRIFSPNNDGSKDVIVFPVQGINIQEGDKISAEVRNEKGDVVRTYRFESKAPEKIVWDGKSDREEDLPQGLYTLSLNVKDIAGNKTELNLGQLEMVRDYEVLSTAISGTAFSPNNDGEKDSVVFTPSVNKTKGLENWTLTIRDSSSNIVKTFSGEQDIPSQIHWDGRDQKGKILKDGKYIYQLKLNYASGNHPSTPPAIVVLDNTPTQVKIIPQYTSFSPNRDGKKDKLEFTHEIVADEDDVLQATIKDQQGNVVYYAKYSGKDFPEKYVWDGLDRDLNPLPEGIYTYTIETTDNVGNKNKIEVARIDLKTGLEKVSVSSDALALSPGSKDGQSRVTFSPQLTSTEGVTAFKLEISDESGKVVKTFESDKVMEKIDWTGTDNQGNKLKDGLYKYKLTVSYNFGDEPVSAVKNIYIDTQAPEIKITPSDLAFSPNNDGRKDKVSFKLDVKGEGDDLFSLLIIQDKSGKAIRTYNWKGSVPSEVIWDGKDAEGNPAPEGDYSIELIGQDQAKNTTRQKIAQLKMKREYESLTYDSSGLEIAPNGDGNQDDLTFTSSISSTDGLEESRLEISDENGNVVRTIKKKKDVLSTVKWDGKDDMGRVVPDGTYYALMSYEFDSGNLVQGIKGPVTLDKTPPAQKLTVSPRLFTPDGDGENDTLYINLELNDANDVKEWAIKIYKVEEGWQKKAPLKTWTGSGAVKRLIEWNGIGDDQEDGVESVQDYVLVLTARDGLGNQLSPVQEIIPVGVLVEKTPDGLRIRISSVTFDVNKANLDAQSKKNLDKVIKILVKIMSDPKKYGLGKDFRIEVSGHTDDTGAEDYNEKLSKSRAQSVYQYLVAQDIDPAILTAKGYGEDRPVKIITPEMSKDQKEKFRAKNRRVEFFIRK